MALLHQILVDWASEFGETFVHLSAGSDAVVEHTRVEARSSL